MRFPIFSIGVDLGGSWVRLEAVDKNRKLLRTFKSPAPPVSQLPAFLKKRLAAWKARPQHLIIASRGIWTTSERSHLKQGCRGLARNVVVMSDVEAAWYAAFDGRPEGVIVISGTGSIAYGRDSRGRSHRAGGWGPLLGDEGSAFWIGKTWLKKMRRYDFAPDILRLVRSSHLAVRRVASMTPRVLRLAKTNRAAYRVVQEAQSHLANLVFSTLQRLRFQKIVPVSWGGSLLNNPEFRAGFVSALRRRGRSLRKTFQWVPPGRTPVSTVSRLF